MRVVIAPDKFAGTMTAADAAAAIARGWARTCPDDELVVVPMADGGEGMLEVVAAAVAGDVVQTPVTGPMGAPVQAGWLQLRDGRAVVEAAAACGLRHVPPEQRSPLRATSAGVGQLLLAAAGAGASQIIVGLGGCATVDGGAGMAVALGARLLGASGATREGADLQRVAGVTPITADLPPIVAAVDVDNPLLGSSGAAAVFAPQKGADPAAVVLLEDRMRRFGDAVERDLQGGPWRDLAGAGAAGGLGFALAAFAGATLAGGAALVAELIGLPASLAGADVVVTGEGSLDTQTLRGKAPDHVRQAARAAGAAVLAVAGRADPAVGDLFDAVQTLGPDGIVRPVALAEQAAARLAEGWRRATPRVAPANA